MANYEKCPNCGSSQISYTEKNAATCIDCAHQWDVDSGKTVGAKHEHDWQLVEVNFTSKGADRAMECSTCPAVQYEPAQATLRDDRPALWSAGTGDTP